MPKIKGNECIAASPTKTDLPSIALHNKLNLSNPLNLRYESKSYFCAVEVDTLSRFLLMSALRA